MGKTCSTYGRIQKCIESLVGVSEGKKPLGRPRRIWEDNIRMELKEEGCDARDWIALAEDRNQWRA